MNLKSSISFVIAIFSLALLAETAIGKGFSAGIAPSKFELVAKPGKVLRDTLTIMNASETDAGFSLRTTDWDINETQGLEYFEDELVEGSCRPWVKLERKVITIRAQAQKRYRFEVHVPEDAEPGLCKFAILVEPANSATASVGNDGQIRFPVVGRYAVIVYVTIGDAKAKADYSGLGSGEMGGLRLPTLKIQNTGLTYDRVFGRINAVDANGRKHLLIASAFPILPGHSEEILLVPDEAENGSVAKIDMKYPLQLKGKFEFGGEKYSLEETFE